MPFCCHADRNRVCDDDGGEHSRLTPGGQPITSGLSGRDMPIAASTFALRAMRTRLYLFSIQYLGDVCRSPLFRRHHDRSYAHNANEDPAPILPGMYPDVVGPVRLADLQLGAFYLRSFDNQALVPLHNDAKRETMMAARGSYARRLTDERYPAADLISAGGACPA